MFGGSTMNTMDLSAWYKPEGGNHSEELGTIHFRIDDQSHLLMEQAEEELLETHAAEKFLPIDMSHMELQMPDASETLEDCQLRVVISRQSGRGQFHIVGHRASDHSLIYSNAVMVDQLG